MLTQRVFLILILITASAYGKVLLWDLGGVLLYPDKFGVAGEIGLDNFLKYMVLEFKNPNIQPRLFEVLELIKVERPERYKHACTENGIALPPIMCQWQAGEKTGPEIIKIAVKHINALGKEGYFESEREQCLMIKTVKAMFDPELLARNVYPVEPAIRLFKECIRVRSTKGKRQNFMIAFSNWDHLSFNNFYHIHYSLFKHFDEIAISGFIKEIKPDPAAFHYVIKKYKLNPAECILIDDQEVNARAAESCGMKCALIKNWDYRDLRRQLVELGALPN